MNTLAAFCAGALFALGLSLSGMTEPARIVRFLDVTGDWDPALVFVMGGAVLMYGVLYRVIVGRLERPLLAERFHVPPRAKVDGKLLLGAGLFGVGWGLAGLCPGPALVALGAGKPEAWLFTGAMVVGSWLAAWLPDKRATAPEHAPRLVHDDA
jgi:uncharacterized protein